MKARLIFALVFSFQVSVFAKEGHDVSSSASGSVGGADMSLYEPGSCNLDGTCNYTHKLTGQKFIHYPDGRMVLQGAAPGELQANAFAEMPKVAEVEPKAPPKVEVPFVIAHPSLKANEVKPGRTIVVQIGFPGCGACDALKPILKNASKQRGHEFLFMNTQDMTSETMRKIGFGRTVPVTYIYRQNTGGQWELYDSFNGLVADVGSRLPPPAPHKVVTR